MNDAAPTENTALKLKKNRPEMGQRFPFIPLPKAIERAKELYKIATTFDIPMVAAGSAWGYSAKSSGVRQCVAAMKAFGLISDTGNSDNRRIKLTDNALKIIRDPRDISPERDALIREAALLPSIHRDIISHFNGIPPSDQIFKAYLLLDKGMKDDAASDFMREFAATMGFAKITASDIVHDLEDDSIHQADDDIPSIAVGDYVQATIGGVDQFREPKRVVWISEDASFVRVESSMTGIPASQIQKVSAPPPPPPAGGNVKFGGFDEAVEENDIKVLLDGDHLRISAYVDSKGLRRLKKILKANEALLNLDDDDEMDEND